MTRIRQTPSRAVTFNERSELVNDSHGPTMRKGNFNAFQAEFFRPDVQMSALALRPGHCHDPGDHRLGLIDFLMKCDDVMLVGLAQIGVFRASNRGNESQMPN